MSHVLVSGKNTIYTVAFNASAKTLTFSNILEWDLGMYQLVSVWDDTVSLYFNLQGATFTNTPAHGVPVWVVQLLYVPAGSANTDSLIVILNPPAFAANYAQQQVIAGATA